MSRLFLIDSFGFIFRAYHARARSGVPPMRTKAGLQTEAVYIFHNMVRRLQSVHKPEYLVAVFESIGPTFRDEVFDQYKANRTETPPELLDQIPWIRKALEAMSIPVIEQSGFEADDVIGTLAKKAVAEGMEVVIVSSDKDMLQLVNGHVRMLNPMKDDMWYDAEETEKFMGVKPEQVADLLALKGDSSDNIPGAPGIGDKGAKEIITRFGSVENALEHAAEVERKMYRESLQNNRDIILLSKKLATIHTDIPLEFQPEAYAIQESDRGKLRELYQTLEFHSLLRELGKQPGGDGAAVVPTGNYHSVNLEELETWVAAIPAGEAVSIALGKLMEQDVLGFSTKESEGISVIYDDKSNVLDKVLKRASIAHDSKAIIKKFGDLPALRRDVMLYGFLLSADPGACSLEALAERNLGQALPPDPAVQAASIFSLYKQLSLEVEKQGLSQLYERIDLPMVGVLARMETTGITVARQALGELSTKLQQETERLTEEIYSLTGKPFNINSPQQLSKVLFEEMGLAPAGAKPRGPAPAGKSFSTAADVLEEIEHPVAQKILDYRQLTKLRGTYADALPSLIDPVTGRLHTTFNQAGAATGRLSSSNPNLQNIPIRTEIGREIRAAFVPRPGWKLIVADYSQIELRLLAHLSKDAVLVEAFRNGEDIHTRTAAEVFGVPPLMVTPEHRRGAKAVNFGIVYGQTAFGLAMALGIDRKEADQYIRAYFERYSGVRRYIDQTIAQVRRSGFAVNMYGRKRPIPEMNSKNPNARGFAERTAVNTPLQGSAADLIKLAMIRIDEKLKGMQTKMLLQVHDELVFEAPPEEVDAVRVMVKTEMEGIERLEVPLIVDVGVGDNWRDAK